MTAFIQTTKSQAVRDVVDTLASHPEGMTTRQLYDKYKNYLADAGLINEKEAVESISKRISRLGLQYDYTDGLQRRYFHSKIKESSTLQTCASPPLAVPSEPPAPYDVVEIDTEAAQAFIEAEGDNLEESFLREVSAAAERYRDNLGRMNTRPQTPVMLEFWLKEMQVMASALRPVRDDWADVLDGVRGIMESCFKSGHSQEQRHG